MFCGLGNPIQFENKNVPAQTGGGGVLVLYVEMNVNLNRMFIKMNSGCIYKWKTSFKRFEYSEKGEEIN